MLPGGGRDDLQRLPVAPVQVCWLVSAPEYVQNQNIISTSWGRRKPLKYSSNSASPKFTL